MGTGVTALTYRREIDGLRAIAVLAVVLYHAGVPALPGGFVGVDVFFVISGYLITSLLVLDWQQHGRLDLVGFYARRVRRLMPALCTVIVASVAIGLLLLAPGNARDGLIHSAVASLLFVANLYFQGTTGTYFDGPSDELPLLHLWSLAVEEQFYLVLPLILIFALRWRGRAGLALILAVASLLSLLFAEHWLQIRSSVAFFQMPARFWELALGGLIGLSPRGLLGGRRGQWVLAVGLLFIAGAIASNPTTHFPGIGAMPAVMGAALALWSIHDGAELGWTGAALKTRPMVFFGLISYSLYLWHWPLLAFERLSSVEPPQLATRLLLCVVAVLLACLSYRYVETPFRRQRPQWRQSRVVMAGAGSSLALIAVLLGLAHALPQPSTHDRVWAIMNDRPANMARCHFGLDDAGSTLQPAECNSDPSTAPQVVLWGDSHALAWQPFAWAVAKAGKESAASFTLDSCAPIGNFDTFRADFPGHRDRCRRHNALVVDYVRQHRPDTLILAGRWLMYFQPRQMPGMSIQSPESTADGLAEAMASVAPYVRRVVIMGPLPVLRGRAGKCVENGTLERCAMPRSEYRAQAAPAWRTFAEIARKYPNVELVDPGDFFCDDKACPVEKDGYALFWDSNHVSSTAAREFAWAYLGEPRRWRVVASAAPSRTVAESAP